MKDKNKLEVFDTPNKEIVRVHSDITDEDGSQKTIEVDMRQIRFVVKYNEVEKYQRIANQLLFAVITTGDKKLRKMVKDMEGDKWKRK